MSKERKFKIAVCFFGHLRTYKKCAPFLRKNLLDKYDCDLFMHTWATLDHNTKTWHKMPAQKCFVKKENIIRTYSEFKGLEIGEQKPLNLSIIKIKPLADSKQAQMSIFGIDTMFHSMRESNRFCEQYAKKTDTKYDFVLCVRSDIILKTPLEINKIIKAFSRQELSRAFFSFTNKMPKCVRGFGSLGENDILFFAVPSVMADVLKNTAQIAGRSKQNALIRYCPEYELIKLVEEHKWTPYRLDYQIGRNWDILHHACAKMRCHFIQLCIRKNFIRIYLLQICLCKIFCFRFAVLNWEFDLCIGASGNMISEI